MTTGARNISSLLDGGALGGASYLIRSGPVVTLSLESIAFDGVNTSYGEFLRMPPGFRPPFTIRDNYDAPSNASQSRYSAMAQSQRTVCLAIF